MQNKSALSFSQRERAFIIVTIIVCPIAFFRFAYTKNMTQIAEFATKSRQLSLSVEQTKQELAGIRTQLSARQPDPAKVSALSPTTDDRETPSLGTIIEKLSHDSRLKHFQVERLVLDKSEDTDGIRKLSFVLKAQTTFIDLGLFIEQLENSELVTEITSIQISREDQELRQISATLQITAFMPL